MPNKTNNKQKRRLEKISEAVMVTATTALEGFIHNMELEQLQFPPSLSATERAYVHELARNYGLISKSTGGRNKRCLTVYKQNAEVMDLSETLQSYLDFSLQPHSSNVVANLLHQYPLSNKDMQLLSQKLRGSFSNSNDAAEILKPGRLSATLAHVPVVVDMRYVDPYVWNSRQSLPIFQYRSAILDTISKNRTTIVIGQTGCGKTTQVPQYIIEDAAKKREAVRIIVAEPRRIAAISMSERVANERGESLGYTVGYQIRLESRISVNTVLTFCTNGILLRTIIGSKDALDSVTHIIVDEVHDRDQHTDFLLLVLRELMPQYPNLKLVLMSANVNVDLFSKYFNVHGAQILEVPSQSFGVTELYLEDVLKLTSYLEPKMPAITSRFHTVATSSEDNPIDQILDMNMSSLKTALPNLCLDALIAQAWNTGDEESFYQLNTLYASNPDVVNYAHSSTGLTYLMIAAARNRVDVCRFLVDSGANVSLRANSYNYTAVDFANHFKNFDIADELKNFAKMENFSTRGIDGAEVVNDNQKANENESELVKLYHSSKASSHNGIDLNLCFELIKQICLSKQPGAILCFLSGYEDIMALRERISNNSEIDSVRYSVYVLHSNVQSNDQRRVFQPAPYGGRKIILATNIAETSITIDDVVHVIDCGKVKQRMFDSATNCNMLSVCNISKASANQRLGRAGRVGPGLCYRLFSRCQFNSMQQYSIPEILRVPIHSLCLQAKLLSLENMTIVDYLSKAPEPPSEKLVRNAVQLLQTIDALDVNEDLTDLGLHICDLPLEPQLAKMLVVGVVLKCLDPVLTIVAALSYRDPYQDYITRIFLIEEVNENGPQRVLLSVAVILPADPNDRAAAKEARNRLADNSFSDHFLLTSVFNGWQKAKADGRERKYCERHWVSRAHMEMIVGIRSQLLGHLRAAGFVKPKGTSDIRELNSNSNCWAVVKAALVFGSYPNCGFVDKLSARIITRYGDAVLSNSSALLGSQTEGGKSMQQQLAVHGLPSEWVIYHEMHRNGRRAELRTVTAVTPLSVALFCGPLRLPFDSDSANGGESSDSECEEQRNPHLSARNPLKLDEWITFNLLDETYDMVKYVRQKFYALFLKRLKNPGKSWTQEDEAVLNAMVTVLHAEEQASNMTRPSLENVVGRRPRPMAFA